LQKLYKELMILGILSIFLFLQEKYEFTEGITGEFNKHIFEHVHMILFLCTVLYITFSTALLTYSILMAKVYEDIEVKSFSEVEAAYKDADRRWKGMNRAVRYLNVPFLLKHHNMEFEYQYKLLHGYFCAQHAHEDEYGGKMTTSYFKFHIYLRKCIREACLQITAIHWQVWLAILILILLNTFRVIIFQVSSVVSFVYIDSVLLWISLIYVMYLRSSIGDVFRTLADERRYRELSPLSKHDEKEAKEEAEEAEIDEEEARHHENKRIMSGGCFSRRASPQQRLFTMQSPANVVNGIQFALLLTSISIPLYFDDLTLVLQSRPSAKVLSELSMFIPPLLILLFGIPHIVPKFVIATSVASMTRHSQIRATLLKQERAAKNPHHGKHGSKHVDEEHGYEESHGSHEAEHGGHEEEHGHEEHEHAHEAVGVHDEVDEHEHKDD